MNRFSSFSIVAFCILFVLMVLTGCASPEPTGSNNTPPAIPSTDLIGSPTPVTQPAAAVVTFTPIAPPTPTSAVGPPPEEALLPTGLPEAVGLTPTQDFFIVNALSEECLDVKGSPGTQNEIPLQLSECEFSDPQTDQRWRFVGTSEGFVVNLSLGKCLDVKDSPSMENEIPVLLDCESSDPQTNQRWTLSDFSGGFVVNLSLEKCLEVKDSSGTDENEALLQLAACENSGVDTGQLWYIK